MWEMVQFFAGMAFVVAIGMALVCLVAYKLRHVRDRVRCNVAVVFGTPLILLVCGYLCRLLGLFLLVMSLPVLIIGLFFGGTVVLAWPRWAEKQIGLSFMLSCAIIYALLIVAYQGAS